MTVMTARKVRKLPQRTCVGCGRVRAKRELIRVVRRPDATVELDLGGRTSGRGAYVCPAVACLEQALKSKKLERQLEVSLPPELQAALLEAVGRAHD